MNTTLNINRLGLLFKRFFIENKQKELIFWGISIAVFTIMHQVGSVEMFTYIAGFIFAARLFSIFAYTPTGMHYLLIPATHTEKLIVNIVLSTIYFFTMILVTYIIGSVVGNLLGSMIFGLDKPINLDLFNDSISNAWNTGNHQDGIFNIFMSFALSQSIFLLGSIFFKRSAIAKTFLSIILVTMALGIIQLILFKLTFGTFHMNTNSFRFDLLGPNFINEIFPNYKMIGTILKYSLIPFFWLVTYFRLTEKQV